MRILCTRWVYCVHSACAVYTVRVWSVLRNWHIRYTVYSILILRIQYTRCVYSIHCMCGRCWGVDISDNGWPCRISRGFYNRCYPLLLWGGLCASQTHWAICYFQHIWLRVLQYVPVLPRRGRWFAKYFWPYGILWQYVAHLLKVWIHTFHGLIDSVEVLSITVSIRLVYPLNLLLSTLLLWISTSG